MSKTPFACLFDGVSRDHLIRRTKKQGLSLSMMDSYDVNIGKYQILVDKGGLEEVVY